MTVTFNVTGMVSALDEAVGNVTAALKDRGFMNDSLLVFTTDNGGPTYLGSNNLPLRGAKTTLWEGGTKGAAFVYSETLLKKTGYLNTGVGKYKLIQGSPGIFNGWTPLPHLHSEHNGTCRVDVPGSFPFPPYQLFDIEADPTEHHDISKDQPEVLTRMKERLAFFRQSLVPAHYPPPDPAADPKHFGGVWSPGWC